jgi:ATP-dependent helicase HepA
LEEVFDHFGLDTEAIGGERGIRILPGERMLLDSFPGIPESGLSATYDRSTALHREDLAFLSIDHPVVRTAVDLVLDGMDGTAGIVAWPESPAKGLALEAIFLLEAIAPGRLHVDRFLPPTPLRVMVDARGEDLSHLLGPLDAARPGMGPANLLEEQAELLEGLLPKLLEKASAIASLRQSTLKKDAWNEADKRLVGECRRLRDLQAVNPSIGEAEVVSAETRAREVMRHIEQAELRLDAARVVIMGRMGL